METGLHTGYVLTVTRQLLAAAAAEPSYIVLEGDDVADFCDAVIDTCASWRCW